MFKSILIMCLFTTPIYAMPKYSLDSTNTSQLLCAMDMIEGEGMAESIEEKTALLNFMDGQSTRKNITYCQEWHTLNRYSSNFKNNIERLRSSSVYRKNMIWDKHIKLVMDFADNKLASSVKLEWIKNKATNFLTCDAIDVKWGKYVRGYRIVGKTIFMYVATEDKGKNLTMWNELKEYCNERH